MQVLAVANVTSIDSSARQKVEAAAVRRA